MFATPRYEAFPREPHSWAHAEYSPRPYQGLTTLLRATSSHHPSFHDSPTHVESHGASSPQQKHEPKKNASRERMKSELMALRVQVGCLETELAYLQQLAQERLTVASEPDENQIRNGREPSGGWKAMAERERVRRIRAEMQNRRLRATVETQMDEWKNLQMLFEGQSQVLVEKIMREQVVPAETPVAPSRYGTGPDRRY